MLAGPIVVLLWSIFGLVSKQRVFKSQEGIWKKLSKGLFIRGGLIFVAVVFGVGGLLGITCGVIRPLENGVVVTCIEGLEKQFFEDELLLNLEHLEKVHGLVPEYYGGEVHDRPTAKEVARIKNQRFVVWGGVRIEKNEDFLATVLIRVTDVTEDKDVFSSDNYTVVAPSKTAIVNRVANDFAVLTVWSLGFANLGWQPTCDSVMRSSQIFAAGGQHSKYGGYS